MHRSSPHEAEAPSSKGMLIGAAPSVDTEERGQTRATWSSSEPEVLALSTIISRRRYLRRNSAPNIISFHVADTVLKRRRDLGGRFGSIFSTNTAGICRRRRFLCSGIVTNLWAPYRGKFSEPTHEELFLIFPFLYKFNLEDDGFDPDSDSRWISFNDKLQIPHLRSKIIEFLAQVRRSKGYDVDFYIDFSASRHWRPYHVFVPRSLDEQEFRELAMAAAKFAIGEINERLGGRNYEIVKVEKLVSTTTNLLLLSFTANEIGTEAFQVMVEHTTPFRLKEWKFKPRIVHKL